MRAPDLATIKEAVVPIQVRIAPLVRLSRFPTTEPYWGKSRRYRFDDPSEDATGRFGVLYLGDSLHTAFAESIIRETSIYADGHYVVAETDLNARRAVKFKRAGRKTLALADFTGLALKGLGLTNDISAGDDYTAPQQWAKAVHAATTLDGIRYVSRQSNDAYAYAVFERSALELDTHQVLTLAERVALCKAFRVRTI